MKVIFINMINNINNKNYDLHTIVVPFVDTNCYVINNESEAILVDAGGSGDEIYDFLCSHGFNLNAILLTHGHYDHIEALDFLKNKFENASIYANANEKIVIENRHYNLANFDLSKDVIDNIKYIDDDSIINELGLDIKMIHTPGHTIGSCCYYIEGLNILFSGDTLFKNTYGRTDLPSGDMKQLVLSVSKKIMKLNDDVVVYPGHSGITSIGYEREHSELMKPFVIDWAEK